LRANFLSERVALLRGDEARRVVWDVSGKRPSPSRFDWLPGDELRVPFEPAAGRLHCESAWEKARGSDWFRVESKWAYKVG
jgi:hypothetical protein